MWYFLVSAGHTDTACPLRAPYLNTGGVVVRLLTADIGSGWRDLPLTRSAEELEAQGQQNPYLQYLRHN